MGARRMLLGACVAAVLALGLPACGQGTASPPLVYEVSSVKLNTSGSGNMMWRSTPTGITMENMQLMSLLHSAYNLDNSPYDSITGLPAWAKSQHWDISAKVAEEDVAAFKKLGEKERAAMLRQLLVERFHLAAHVETQEKPIYALVVGKKGAKLTEAKVELKPDGTKPGSHFSVNNGHIEAYTTTLDQFASMLINEVERTVLNRTGLTGAYDIDLRWTPAAAADAAAKGGDGSSAAAAPPLFTALQEQLGLRLDAERGPVDGLVVDHIDMPTAN